MISEPSRPEGPLLISNIEANSVHLSWKPPLEDNGGPILGYVIEAKDVLHMDVRKTYVWSEGPGTECLVPDLETGHIYQFRVYAQNEAGRSEGLLNKSLVRIKAKSKKPPKPSKPSAEILGEDSVLLQWTVPEGGGNLNYLIERYEPKSDLWFQCNREMVIATSYLVTGLNLDREYIFRVSSENTHGVSLPSEASDPVKYRSDEGEAPFVIVPLEDCFIRACQKAFFKCEYSGTRPIQVNWTKDDIRIREGVGSVVTLDDSGKSELTLNEVDSDDEDCEVQCSLQNAFGRTTSEASIRILSMPQLGYPSSYKEDLTFDCGDAVRLRVTFSGKPPPTIKWFFNGQDPPLNDRVLVTQLSDSLEIRIQDLTAEDSGVYTFVASNVMGEDSIDVRVVITGPPDPPSGHLKFEIGEDDEIVLEWAKPLCDGGSEIFNYIVEKRMSEKELWVRYETTHKTSLNLGNSNEIEGCVFRVRATNIYGTSEPSEECKFQKSGLDEDVSEESAKSLNNQQQKDILSLMQQCSDEKQEEFVIKSELQHEDLEIDILEYEEEDLAEISSNARHIDLIIPQFSYFCNTCTEIFCQAPNFASEIALPAYCPVFDLHCDFFYQVCFSNIFFETVSTLSENEYFASNCLCSWMFHENFLEVYKPLCFLDISKQTDLFDSSLRNKCQWESDDSDTFRYFAVQNEENHSTYFQETSIPCELHQSSSSVIILCPPLTFEVLSLFEVQQPMKQQCRESFICYKSIRNVVINSLETFQNLECFCLSEKATIRYQSFEDFEDIISLCSTPIRTWKPAMSVLPIKRQIATTDLSSESYPKTKDSKPFDNYQEISDGRQTEIESFSVCEKNFPEETKEQLFSFSVLKSNTYETDTSNETDTEFWNNTNFFPMNEQEIELPIKIIDDSANLKTASKSVKDNKIFDISTEDSNENPQINKREIPDWLIYVSPYIFPSTEINLKESNLKLEDEIKTNEIKPTSDNSFKLNLKEKSVEELLQLAEEVERSFSQKAEQFESLESILQVELTSLEKDLEAVSDIHKILDDPFLDSYPCDELNKHSATEQNAVEENLIEFTDVPCKYPGDLQTSGYPPEVVMHLQNRVIQSGCRTRLYCSIMGDPDPEIVWMKNRKPVPESSRYIFSNLVEFGVYMDIFNAKSTDSGEYTCIATNCYGSARTQSYLQVVGNREVSPEEPKFLKSPEDISCSPGESVVMEWRITGTPMPHVIWFKNAERVETSLRMDAFSNHRGCCRLFIRDVDVTDNAIYTCYLENETGSAISTVQLSVEDPESTGSFQKSCKNQLLAGEESVPPKISSSPLSVEERDCGAIRVKRKAYSYEKHCRRNEHENPVGSVAAPHVLSSGQTWTILTWSPPLEGRGRYEYLIEKRLLNSDHWTEVGRTYNTLYTVHGLKRGRSYVFRVSAGNSRGWSLPATVSQPVHTLPR
ncbi:titin homolog isoform X2 [Argiope bruennichi]|uniref:titin homolog isoform X2 n=1 Tax=Argiope bruennichi TaxID=94029 RepID=UPI002494F197|nr:titin homolog isoform X2 [Argiope bruennichi]